MTKPLTMKARILALDAKKYDRDQIAGIVDRGPAYISAVISGFRSVKPAPVRADLVCKADIAARRRFVDQRKLAFKRAAAAAKEAAANAR